FDHRPQAIGAHADGDRDEAALRDGGIEDAPIAVTLLKPLGGAKEAAEEADILAEDENIGIAIEHHVHGGVERLDHGHLGHQALSSRDESKRASSACCSARCQGISL